MYGPRPLSTSSGESEPEVAQPPPPPRYAVVGTVDDDGALLPLEETLRGPRPTGKALARAMYASTRAGLNKTGRYLRRKLHPTGAQVGAFLLDRVPLVRTVATYRWREYLMGDVIAGVSIATILIPQSIAYATVAGLPPIYGLYSSFIPMAVYALFGTCQQLSVAPVSILSLVVYQTLNAMVTFKANPVLYVQLAIYLCLVSGLIQIMMGVLRLGFLMRYLSPAVLTGFISGSAINIACGQLANLFGVSLASTPYTWMIIYELGVELHNTKWLPITSGILTIAIILLVRKWKRSIPIAFIMVVIMTVISWVLQTYNGGQPSLPVTGYLPQGLPVFAVPTVPAAHLGEIITGGLLCVAIGYMESYSLALKMASKHKYRVDPDQEMMALGAANAVGAFFQSYPVTGSFSRTAECDLQGGKTILYSVICIVAVVLSLLFLTPVFYYIPKSTLAAVIIAAVYRLVDVKKMRVYYQTDRSDFAIAVLTFIAVLAADTENGLAIGVGLSALAILYNVASPYVAHLGAVPLAGLSTRYVDTQYHPQAVRSDVVAVVRYDGPLVFANSQHFADELQRLTTAATANTHVDDYLLEARMPPPLAARVVILDASALVYVDTPGALAIQGAAETLAARQTYFFLAGVRTKIKETMHALKVLHGVGPDAFFLSVEDAIAHVQARQLLSKPYTPSEAGPASDDGDDHGSTHGGGHHGSKGDAASKGAAATTTELALAGEESAGMMLELMPSHPDHTDASAGAGAGAAAAGSVILTLPDLDNN